MIEVIRLLPKSNWLTITISLCSFIFLYATKCYLYAKLVKLTGKKLVIPYELILVVVTTAIVYVFDLEVSAAVRVVGNIPSGLPAPELPRFFPHPVTHILTHLPWL